MNSFEQQRYQDNINTCFVIPREIIAREADLIRTTWFGYRFMSPWQRTQLFEKCYAKARKEALSLRISTAAASEKRDYAVSWTTQNRELTKLWKARQRADELCLPYEFIIGEAFKITELAERKNLCLPEQLIPDWHKDGQEALKIVWAEKMHDDINEKRWVAFGRIRGDEGAPFRQEHFQNLKAQIDLHNYLISERERQHRDCTQFILTYRFKERMLSSVDADKVISSHPRPDQVREQISYEYDRWLRSGKPFEAPLTPKKDVCTLQGCYGLMHNYDDRTDCKTCPLQKACQHASEQCEIETCGTIGGVDPVTARKRQKDAERQRNFRRNRAARRDPAQRKMLELIEKAARQYRIEKTAP